MKAAQQHFHISFQKENLNIELYYTLPHTPYFQVLSQEDY
jgi:hypothetical protein